MRYTRGFSLLEATIAVAIFTMMALAIVTLYLRYGTSFTRQSATINVAQSAAATVNEAERYVREARRVVSSHVIGATTYSSDSGTLVLELPSITAAGDIIDGGYDYVIFYSSGTNLYRLIEADSASARDSATKTLTDALNSITFTYNDANVTLATAVTLDIYTEATVRDQTIQTHLTHTIYLRNF